jgi:hypothetical protein
VPGWSGFEQAVAWFKAWLHARGSRDGKLQDLAARELSALGIHIAPTRRERLS